MTDDDRPTRTITYEELKQWRARHPGAYFIGPVQGPDAIEIALSWPWSPRYARDEAERWVGELARVNAFVLESNPPLDTPLDGSVIEHMERIARYVQRLELDAPDIWDKVEKEVERLRSRPRR